MTTKLCKSCRNLRDVESFVTRDITGKRHVCKTCQLCRETQASGKKLVQESKICAGVCGKLLRSYEFGPASSSNPNTIDGLALMCPACSKARFHKSYIKAKAAKGGKKKNKEYYERRRRVRDYAANPDADEPVDEPMTPGPAVRTMNLLPTQRRVFSKLDPVACSGGT